MKLRDLEDDNRYDAMVCSEQRVMVDGIFILKYLAENEFKVINSAYDKNVAGFLEHFLQINTDCIANELCFCVNISYFITDIKPFEGKAWDFKAPKDMQQWWEEAQTIPELLALASWSNLQRPLRYFCENPKSCTVKEFKELLCQDLVGEVVFDSNVKSDWNLENCLEKFMNGLDVSVPFRAWYEFHIDFTNFQISLKREDKMFPIRMINV